MRSPPIVPLFHPKWSWVEPFPPICLCHKRIWELETVGVVKCETVTEKWSEKSPLEGFIKGFKKKKPFWEKENKDNHGEKNIFTPEIIRSPGKIVFVYSKYPTKTKTWPLSSPHPQLDYYQHQYFQKKNYTPLSNQQKNKRNMS